VVAVWLLHVMEIGICCLVEPLVADTVVAYAPGWTLVLALSRRKLVPDPGAARVLGSKVAVIPLGSPLTEKVTVELKPPLTATVRITLLVDPVVSETALEEAVTRKAGVAVASFQCAAKSEASMEPSPVT